MLLCPSSLFKVSDFKCMILRKLKKHLSCHSFLVAFCTMAQMVTFHPNPFSVPAHLKATWGPAVTAEAEVGEGGCAIGRWWEHQLPEQSTFGPRENCRAMAALHSSFQWPSLGLQGTCPPLCPPSDIPSFYIQLHVPSPASHGQSCLPGGKGAELSETHKPFIWA